MLDYYGEEIIKELIEQLCKMRSLIKIGLTPEVMQIQKRANLSVPTLLFLTQTRQKYCNSIRAVIEKIEDLREKKKILL